ncbi:MAG: anti-sigma factor family protein [Saprospiraceae bacterium]
MMNENQLENINRYLDNEMSVEERKAFEKQLRNDEELTEELEFYKDFHGYAERRKPALRQDLSDFGDKYIIEPNKKKSAFSYWISIPILLLIAIVCYFLFFQKDNPIQGNTVPTNTETQLPTNNSEEKIENNSEDNSNKDSEESVDEPKKNNEPNSPKPSINQPIAALNKADFEPNPILEAVIKETYRETVVQDSTILSAPAPDEEFKFGSSIPILVEGLTTVSPNYVINIYSNRSFDVENDFPILNAPISAKAENGQYRFRFNGNIPLKKGLYYLVIKKDNLIEIIHISRFTVK